MELKVEISPEDVNREVCQAILNSAIGTQITKALTASITTLERDWDNPVRKVIDQEVYRVIMETVREQQYLEVIRAAVKEKLTETLLQELVSAAWKAFEEKLG